MPTNVSIINDYMRNRDRSWKVDKATGGTFSMVRGLVCVWGESRADF